MSSTASAETYRGAHPASRGVDLALPEADIELQADANVGTAGQDVPEGIHDPVFPVVVLGMISLIVILAIAAILAL